MACHKDLHRPFALVSIINNVTSFFFFFYCFKTTFTAVEVATDVFFFLFSLAFESEIFTMLLQLFTYLPEFTTF